MTIPEEIELLKTQITGAKGEEEAELILTLLNRYASIKSAGSKPYIERLLQLAKELSSTRLEAWGLYYLALNEHINGQFDASINFTQQSLALFEQLNDTEGLANAYANLGNIRGRQDNYTEALKNHTKALQIREETGNKADIAASYNNIGHVHEDQGNYPEALKNYIHALKLREETGNKKGIASSFNSIGLIYQYQGAYDDALKNQLRALQIQEEIGYKPGMAVTYNNLGVTRWRQGNINEALEYYLKALQIREALNDQHGLVFSYINIGAIYHLQADEPETSLNQRTKATDKALESFLKALEIARAVDDKRGIAAAYHGIGGHYAKQGDYAQALSNNLLALQFAGELGYKLLVKECAQSLFNNYKDIHDFENALTYHEKYHQVESEMLGEQAQKQLTQLNFQHNLEQKEKDLEIEQLRNVELKREKDRSENLLLNILPAEVAEELKEKGTADAKLFDNVTVLFTDFKGFTTLTEKLSPQQLVDELHACFSAFDEICGKHNIEKIKTVGDAYLAVSGLPLANPGHAEDLLRAAIEIRDFMKARKSQIETFEIRIGIHSGSVVAGIVGVKKFAYDIWGDTVNIAARMEQNSEAGKINISQTTYELVKGKFNCEYRGEIEAKNKGKLRMYFVE
jgi:adenylate cyclase